VWRALVRGLVPSGGRGRTSRWEQPGDRPPERHFAVAVVRPLTPMQFSLSLATATTNPLELAQRLENADEWKNRRRDLENHVQGFAQQLEIPGEKFQGGVAEALLFSNNQHIENEYLRDAPDRLVGAIKGISDRPHMIQTAFRAVLSRDAQPEEIEPIVKYLAAREDHAVPAIQQFLWALLTG